MPWQRVMAPDCGGLGESMSIKLAGEGGSRRENARRGAGGVV